jgi:tRNA(Glu) U13 pseudouridine synthase TruD
MTLRPLGLSVRREGAGAWLSFALPSGAFATTIVGALIDPEASFRRSVDAR